MVWGLVVSGIGGAAASLVAGSAGRGGEVPVAEAPKSSEIVAPAEMPAEVAVPQPDVEEPAAEAVAVAVVTTPDVASPETPDAEMAEQPADAEVAVEQVPQANAPDTAANEGPAVAEPEMAVEEEPQAEPAETMAPASEETPAATGDEAEAATTAAPETMVQESAEPVEPVTETVVEEPVAEPVEEAMTQPEAAESEATEMAEIPVEVPALEPEVEPVEEAMQDEALPQVSEEAVIPEATQAPVEDADTEVAVLPNAEVESESKMEPAVEAAEVAEPEAAPQQAEDPSVPEMAEEPAPDMAEEPEVVEQPAPEAKNPETEVATLPQILSPQDTPQPEATPEPEPKPEVENSTPKVQVNRLPTIGGTTEPEAPEAEAPAEDAQKDKTALEAFAMPFENPDAKPMLSVVLIDNPDAPVSDDALAHLPFALSFAIDAAREDAGQAAARYRKAGFEVLMITNLPQGASASDVEVAFEAYLNAIPEAVAVLDRGATSKEATQIAGILADRGLGLITPSKGLNSAQKAAQREGVPAALIYRELDSAGETVPAIRQYLNRAAFRAAQEGSVIMLGSTRSDTIEALVLWALEDRAASVAIAPVSAVLKGGE